MRYVFPFHTGLFSTFSFLSEESVDFDDHFFCAKEFLPYHLSEELSVLQHIGECCDDHRIVPGWHFSADVVKSSEVIFIRLSIPLSTSEYGV